MISISKFEVLVLDFDGVIIDSEKAQIEAWKTALTTNKLPVDMERIIDTVGWKDEAIVTQIVNEIKKRDVILNSKKEIMERMYERGEVKPIPGVCNFVINKSKTHKIAIASNSKRSRIDSFLDEINCEEFRANISLILTGEGKIKPKPNPDIYLKLLQKLNITSDLCVVVEDSIGGLEAAKNAGLSRIGFASTLNENKLLPYTDLGVVHTFDEIV